MDEAMGTVMVYRPHHNAANENGMVPKHMLLPHGVDAGFYVISDTMDPTWHPATGRMMDSKSNFRRQTKASGCIEVGNEQLRHKPRPPMPPVMPDLIRAYEELKSR